MLENISYRLIKSGEEKDAFSIVDRGFDSFIRKDFTAEGADEFFRAIQYMIFNKPPNHFTMIALSESEIVGVIVVKEYDHVSVFFVEPSLMGQGIGRGLLENSLTICRQNKADLKEIDVNSSPWAVPVYQKLGFKSDGPEQEVNGIRFTRMVKQL